MKDLNTFNYDGALEAYRAYDIDMTFGVDSRVKLDDSTGSINSSRM